MKPILLLLSLAFITLINTQNLKSTLENIKKMKEDFLNKIKECVNEEGSAALKEFVDNLKNIKSLKDIKLTDKEKKAFENCKKAVASSFKKVEKVVDKNKNATSINSLNKFKSMFKKQ